jgi:hypothetical protein
MIDEAVASLSNSAFRSGQTYWLTSSDIMQPIGELSRDMNNSEASASTRLIADDDEGNHPHEAKLKSSLH